jgi:hypothetical protein
MASLLEIQAYGPARSWSFHPLEPPRKGLRRLWVNPLGNNAGGCDLTIVADLLAVMRGQTLNLSFNVRLGQIKRADGTGAFAVGWTEEDAIYVSPESCGCTARIHLMCHFPVRQGKPDSLEMQVEPRVCRVDRVNSVSSIRSQVWLCL